MHLPTIGWCVTCCSCLALELCNLCPCLRLRTVPQFFTGISGSGDEWESRIYLQRYLFSCFFFAFWCHPCSKFPFNNFLPFMHKLCKKEELFLHPVRLSLPFWGQSFTCIISHGYSRIKRLLICIFFNCLTTYRCVRNCWLLAKRAYSLFHVKSQKATFVILKSLFEYAKGNLIPLSAVFLW